MQVPEHAVKWNNQEWYRYAGHQILASYVFCVHGRSLKNASQASPFKD